MSVQEFHFLFSHSYFCSLVSVNLQLYILMIDILITIIFVLIFILFSADSPPGVAPGSAPGVAPGIAPGFAQDLPQDLHHELHHELPQDLPPDLHHELPQDLPQELAVQELNNENDDLLEEVSNKTSCSSLITLVIMYLFSASSPRSQRRTSHERRPPHSGDS